MSTLNLYQIIKQRNRYRHESITNNKIGWN